MGCRTPAFGGYGRLIQGDVPGSPGGLKSDGVNFLTEEAYGGSRGGARPAGSRPFLGSAR